MEQPHTEVHGAAGPGAARPASLDVDEQLLRHFWTESESARDGAASE